MHDFFQHKTGRVIIFYVNLKTGFYDLHKNEKNRSISAAQKKYFLLLPTIGSPIVLIVRSVMLVSKSGM